MASDDSRSLSPMNPAVTSAVIKGSALLPLLLDGQVEETLKQKEGEQSWKILTGLAPAFGWAYDRGFFDENEEGDY